MKKTLLIGGSAFLVAFIGFSFTLTKKYNSGIAGQTGSPGEQTCSACHSGGASGSQTINVMASPSFSNNQYLPGTVYNLSVTISGAGSSFTKHGFGFEALNSSNVSTGTLQAAGSGVTFANAANGRRNAIHTTGKTGSGGATFTFQWKAPNQGEGDVTFYYCGNAVNGNGNTNGDLPIPGSLTIGEGVITITTSVKSEQQIISKVSVFPNPASGNINVSYHLNEAQAVSVELYDLNGKQFKTLLTENQAAGNYEKNISLQNAGSGIYFLRISANGNKLSQKMIVVN